jgi:predicted transglutaminase-like cysteine proteinase
MVETINIAVNSDHPYSHYTRKVSQARVLKPGEPGNCTDIALTKKVELAKAGIHSIMFACNLKSGEGHAFLMLDDGRVLDSRFDEVVPYSEVACR